MDKRLIIVPFEKSHVIGLSLTTQEQKYQHALETVDFPEGTWTGFYEDLIIGFGGTVVVDDKVAAWVLFTDAVTPKSLLASFLYLRKYAKEYERQGIKLFFHIDPDHDKAERWANLLGFKPVGYDQVLGQRMQRFEK